MRTHYISNINKDLIGFKISLCGWIHNIRIHKNFVFVDIRDISGLFQVNFSINSLDNDIFVLSTTLKREYVIQVHGYVQQRKQKSTNINIHQSSLELLVDNFLIINKSKKLPLDIYHDKNNKDEIRLKYRYLDLRNLNIQKNIVLRSKITTKIKDFLDKHKFLYIETPIMNRPSFQGAKTYVIHYRDELFYSLAQSPQIFKQLLMISGFDRYYQFSKCFRNENLRSDRQIEFTQVDIELSFMNENQIMLIIEDMLYDVFYKTLGIKLCVPFKRMNYHDAIYYYGTDKPDLRINIKFVDLTSELKKDQQFMLMTHVLDSKNIRIISLCLPNSNAKITNNMIQEYCKFVKLYGLNHLFYIRIDNMDTSIRSSIKNKININTINLIIKKNNANNGDFIFFAVSSSDIVNKSMSLLRNKLGCDLNLFSSSWNPVWIVNFPLFKKENNQLHSVHHPFTAPLNDSITYLNEHYDKILSKAYDLVINGYEIGGGSIRINNRKIQELVFKMIGLSDKDIIDNFDFLLEALEYGAPVHGGIALGLDRLVMLMSNQNNIRDIIAFPKTYQGYCLMTQAPNKII